MTILTLFFYELNVPSALMIRILNLIASLIHCPPNHAFCWMHLDVSNQSCTWIWWYSSEVQTCDNTVLTFFLDCRQLKEWESEHHSKFIDIRRVYSHGVSVSGSEVANCPEAAQDFLKWQNTVTSSAEEVPLVAYLIGRSFHQNTKSKVSARPSPPN